MKKALLFVLIVGLFANGSNADEILIEDTSTSYAVTAEEVAVTAEDLNMTSQPGTQVQVYEQESEFQKASLAKKAAIIVGTPIGIAGMVVTGVVVAPIWAVKKIFE